MRSSLRRLGRSWYLILPALFVAAGVLVPLAYLIWRAVAVDAARLDDLLLRWRTLALLGNTVALTVGVLGLGSLIAFPLAWLTTRTDLAGRRIVTLLGVVPLAIPGYVMAYAWLGATGEYGMMSQLFGLDLPRPGGFTGALLALGFSSFPYLFLNLRTTLLGLDPALEESARALGFTPWQVFRRVTLPQLRPAFLSGGLLVGLHVLGDFGVVSLMRFETFSYALYLQYQAAFDRTHAALLALLLLILTGSVLFAESRLLKGLLYHRAGSGSTRRRTATLVLGRWRNASWAFVGLVAVLVVGLPVASISYWTSALTIDGQLAGDLWSALVSSVSASAPAALLAGLLALPLAYLGVRRPSTLTRGLERIAYFGYATPPLAFALAFVFFSLRSVPAIYQTLGLLVVAYALHFLAEAIGPVRSALYQAPPRLEEAARALGRSPLRAFFEASFPLLQRGLMVSIAFVFLSAMKELPITFLLAPAGFRTLALTVWDYAGEALFPQAAPFAIAIICVSAAFVGLLLAREESPEPTLEQSTT